MSGLSRIRLDDERRAALVQRLVEYTGRAIDVELSPFQAERIVELFLKELGSAVYNQAIADARGFLHEKLEDLDAEFYEPEERGSSE